MADMTVTRYQEVLAARYDALPSGVIPPLREFVDGVLAEVASDYCVDETHIGGCPCRIGGDVVCAADESRLR